MPVNGWIKKDMDDDIGELLKKLYGIQKEVGGGDIVHVSRNLTKDGKCDRFLDVKSLMAARFRQVQELDGELSNLQASTRSPREVIQLQQKIRDEIRTLNDEWREMSSIYEKERRKKASKFSEEELDMRGELVRQYAKEIEDTKRAVQSKYVKNPMAGGNNERRELLGSATSSSSGGKRGISGKVNSDMTDNQKRGLLQVQDNDAKIDGMLDSIGHGVTELGQLAQNMNDEVRRQNVMLEGLDEKMTHVHDHVTNVNVNMKSALKKVKSADKFCMEVVCLLLLLGIVSLLYKFLTD